MEQFFTSLSKRQTMLLLTALTFGGQESLASFDHLPDEEAELLRHRAEQILRIPRERRIPLLVQEIKRLVTARRGQVWSADPARLAQAIAGERPLLIEVVLRALPIGTAEAVRKHLPPDLPRAKVVREVKPQVLHIVRWKLEEALTRTGPRRPGFKFSDVLLLKSREVLTLIDRLGARALAQAVAGLPDAERDGFLARLNPDQRQVTARLAAAVATRALNEADAKTLIASFGADADPSEGLRSAGAQRLARASLAQSPEFAARLVERHPGALGQLLLKWIREERPRISGRIDGGRTDVVNELERLEQLGIIDKPVRLPPPPLRPPPAQPPRPPPRSTGPGDLPGGRIVPPKPRLPGEYRDPIAERQARRAGVPIRPSSSSSVPRDSMAEREARRAGALSSRPYDGEAVPPREWPREADRDRGGVRTPSRRSDAGMGPLVPPPERRSPPPGAGRPATPRGPEAPGRPTRADRPMADAPRAPKDSGGRSRTKPRPASRPAPPPAQDDAQEIPTAPGLALQGPLEPLPRSKRDEPTSLQRPPRQRPPGRGPRGGSG